MKRNTKIILLIVGLIAFISIVYRGYKFLRKPTDNKCSDQPTYNYEGASETVTDKVIFEVSIGDKPIGQIQIGLFGDKAPETVGNFLEFAGPGVNGKKYEGSIFHRVIKDFMIQGGDVVNGDGTGSISKYGSTFKDELPSHKHSVPGLMSMANRGPNTNGSQFFITTVLTHWLDGKHVVFGKVLDEDSMKVVYEIENTEVVGNHPEKPIKITKSTVVGLGASERFPVDIGYQ